MLVFHQLPKAIHYCSMVVQCIGCVAGFWPGVCDPAKWPELPMHLGGRSHFDVEDDHLFLVYFLKARFEPGCASNCFLKTHFFECQQMFPTHK